MYVACVGSPHEHLARELLFQGEACARLGSPLYASLMVRAAENALAGGVIAELLAPHLGSPRGAAIVLRLFGTVHRIALSGDAPELARWYPSCGGRLCIDDEKVWESFLGVCNDHRTRVAEGLGQPPQTNEVGRGAAMRGALELTALRTSMPLRLFEIGTSAGLNLRADLFRVGTPTGDHGPPNSPVCFPDAWHGNVPIDAALDVRDRRGCDIAPIKLGDADAELRLQSYVWPDQLERLERLRAAIDLARSVPADVIAQSADEFLTQLHPVEGAATVIQHSVMWQYLPDDTRAACQSELDRLRCEATVSAPVAHISLEPRRRADNRDVDYRRFELAVSWACWPEQEEKVVAKASPHGPPVYWL